MIKWDDFEADVVASRSEKGKPCGMYTLLTGLPRGARESVEKALSDPRHSATSIRTALVKRLGEDSVPGTFTVRIHRRGECRCGRGKS